MNKEEYKIYFMGEITKSGTPENYLMLETNPVGHSDTSCYKNKMRYINKRFGLNIIIQKVMVDESKFNFEVSYSDLEYNIMNDSKRCNNIDLSGSEFERKMFYVESVRFKMNKIKFCLIPRILTRKDYTFELSEGNEEYSMEYDIVAEKFDVYVPEVMVHVWCAMRNANPIYSYIDLTIKDKFLDSLKQMLSLVNISEDRKDKIANSLTGCLLNDKTSPMVQIVNNIIEL